MHSDSFMAVSEEIGKALQEFHELKQDGALERKAQKTVDEIFKKHKARRKPVTLEGAGIEIVGCVLAFGIGTIGIGRWLTSFYPVDRYDVLKTDPIAIPLGYVNGAQLYIRPQSATLTIRYGMGYEFNAWSPKLQGTPPTNTIFYVALERARLLGYLSMLQDQ